MVIYFFHRPAAEAVRKHSLWDFKIDPVKLTVPTNHFMLHGLGWVRTGGRPPHSGVFPSELSSLKQFVSTFPSMDGDDCKFLGLQESCLALSVLVERV